MAQCLGCGEPKAVSCALEVVCEVFERPRRLMSVGKARIARLCWQGTGGEGGELVATCVSALPTLLAQAHQAGATDIATLVMRTATVIACAHMDAMRAQGPFAQQVAHVLLSGMQQHWDLCVVTLPFWSSVC